MDGGGGKFKILHNFLKVFPSKNENLGRFFETGKDFFLLLLLFGLNNRKFSTFENGIFISRARRKKRKENDKNEHFLHFKLTLNRRCPHDDG